MALNGAPLTLNFSDNAARSVFQVPFGQQQLHISVNAYCDSSSIDADQLSRHVLFFDLISLNSTTLTGHPSFTISVDSTALAEVVVVPPSGHPDQCSYLDSHFDPTSSVFLGRDIALVELGDDASQGTDASSHSPSDEQLTIEELRERLHEERELIRTLTMACQIRLTDELRECKSDIKCSGKAICHHLHTAIMHLMGSLRSSLQQSPMVSDHRQQWQAIIGDEKSSSYGTIKEALESPTDNSHRKHALIVALEILAGALGITALLSLIRRRFRSFRRRAERLADREERRRAREYRRLARKEAIRRKWVAFKGVFSFIPYRKCDDEEKRALILEAAALATGESVTITDLEQAWDEAFDGGMRPSMREVQRVETNYLVSLAESSQASELYKQMDNRSRSSSLPSYESEKLPSYTGARATDAFRAYSPSVTGSLANTIVTPDSSIPDISPRCSGETLRTIISRD